MMTDYSEPGSTYSGMTMRALSLMENSYFEGFQDIEAVDRFEFPRRGFDRVERRPYGCAY
jgi:hypothetical protein